MRRHCQWSGTLFWVSREDRNCTCLREFTNRAHCKFRTGSSLGFHPNYNNIMCGIAGFWSTAAQAGDVGATLSGMSACISHRGPDDDGHWCDSSAGIGLGFRRLAILDLSPAGHQPMASASDRYVVVFNGEIYNFADLREQLGPDHSFRGHSDTEILLAAIEKWGIHSAIERSVGMFAIALWDRTERVLHLIRDRLGEKPLYYGVVGDALLFGSELKALRQHPNWTGEIDRGSIALYLRHNYVPAPYSIFANVRKVVPGTIVTFREGRMDSPEVAPYWSPLEVAERGIADPIVATDNELIDQLDTLLRNTIAGEMVADVPLGAFLSGGVDSSALVALMQAQSSTPIKTFTIGFNERAYNEAGYAKAVAERLGTDHTEIYVTPEEALGVIPLLPAMYDEPFADSSQIPTFLVAKLARRDVTVSLSGEGGDELFAGYNRYFWGERLWGRIANMPQGVRATVGRSLQSVSPSGWDTAFSAVGRVIPSRLRTATPGHKVHKVAALMGVATPDEMYRSLMTHWPDPEGVTGFAEPETVLTRRSPQPSFDGVVNRMRYFDLVSELPDDILVKVDRATMAVSLESRAPFLDHRVVEFAWRIPLSQQVRNGEGKWLLRQVLYRYVPRELIERPKMGFGVPIDSWLRGPLKEWAAELIDPDRLRREGFLQPGPITEAWKQHQSGATNNAHLLWGVLMFQAWLEHQQQ